jgi:hypothetical protein
MNNYQNEAGEWLMDGAAIRAEWAADEYAAYERELDNYEDDYYDEPECTPETHGVEAAHELPDGTWECDLCLEPCSPNVDEYEMAEDAHLDGMWEE